jgi:hypothetical protein
MCIVIAIDVESPLGFGARGLLTGRLQTASALTFLNFFFYNSNFGVHENRLPPNTKILMAYPAARIDKNIHHEAHEEYI